MKAKYSATWCVLCKAPVEDPEEPRCPACITRCMGCGTNADPATAGDGEATGRYCIDCDSTDGSGCMTLWEHVFRLLRRDADNDCYGGRAIYERIVSERWFGDL